MNVLIYSYLLIGLSESYMRVYVITALPNFSMTRAAESVNITVHIIVYEWSPCNDNTKPMAVTTLTN